MQLFHADFPVTRFAAEGLEHPAVLDIFELPFFFFFFMKLCSFLLSTWSSSLASTVLVKTFILLPEPFQSSCHILLLYHGVGQSTSSFFHYRISNFTLLIERNARG